VIVERFVADSGIFTISHHVPHSADETSRLRRARTPALGNGEVRPGDSVVRE
jgi:hypothetical protein